MFGPIYVFFLQHKPIRRRSGRCRKRDIQKALVFFFVFFLLLLCVRRVFCLFVHIVVVLMLHNIFYWCSCECEQSTVCAEHMQSVVYIRQLNRHCAYADTTTIATRICIVSLFCFWLTPMVNVLVNTPSVWRTNTERYSLSVKMLMVCEKNESHKERKYMRQIQRYFLSWADHMIAHCCRCWWKWTTVPKFKLNRNDIKSDNRKFAIFLGKCRLPKIETQQ